MTAIFERLSDIARSYSVFVQDQVLTHEQLNSLAAYIDDQVHLTRVELLGSGLIYGMRPRWQSSAVHVGAGIGLTTDGDLLFVEGGARFTHYRPFDPARPRYAPLYEGPPEDGQLRTVFELLSSAEGAPEALPLSEFPDGVTALRQMVVVAYMESYVKDDELCTGTDCDNLGQDLVDQQLILMLPSSEIASLREQIPTPHDAWEALPQVRVGRPQLSPKWTTTAQLAGTYRAACRSATDDLQAAFERLDDFADALGPILDHADVPSWTASLATLESQFAATTIGIQYYYGLLVDLADTWNGFCELLFEDRMWLHAPPSRFSKHLLLGNIDIAEGDETNRTRFYPTPLLRIPPDTRAHAGMLLRKIGALLASFAVDTNANQAIRVTPTAGEDQPLEQRAVPIYYPKAGIIEDWSHAHRVRGTSARIWSYNAALWSGETQPLLGRIARFDWFRVEGHLGRPVAAALTDIEALITTHNLPFAVEAIFLNQTRDGLLPRPPRYTDLHRMHRLMRQDLVQQLDGVESYGLGFQAKLAAAAAAGNLPPTPPDGPSYQELAQQNQQALSQSATAVREVLNQPYSSYRDSSVWQGELNQALQKAGELKNIFGVTTKTEFATPIDSLFGSPNLEWLGWLDDIIGERQDADDERRLFGKFVAEHPGLEHVGGVRRGGTLVLVYDQSNTVVADFSLSYRCCEAVELEPNEPPLPPGSIKPPWIVTDGIRFVVPQDRLIDSKILQFEGRLKDEIVPRLDVQEQYFKFQDSITQAYDDLIDKALPLTRSGGQLQAQDELLGAMLRAADVQNQILTQLRARNAPPEQIAKAEAGASEAVAAVVDHIRGAEPSFALGLGETQVLGQLPPSQRNAILAEVAKKGGGFG